jgi:hypothetical protein
MKGLLTLAFALSVISCKKEQVPVVCNGISMSGNKNVFVGK